MDEELTSGYSEPCPRCSETFWGVTDDGQFFCQNCHNVIERTRDVVEAAAPGMSRVSSIKKGPRVKRAEGGRQWFVCEGFQFILKSQAEALVQLGVDHKFKDEVLVRLWRLYLQKSRQAYTYRPVCSASFRMASASSDSEGGPDSGSGLDSVSGLDSGSELDCRSVAGSQIYSQDSDGSQVSAVGSTASGRAPSDWSVGSLDSEAFVSQSGRRRRGQMSMKKTLALLYVALVWSRQQLTLTDLLSLVEQGLVPYLNAYECFPEEMKLNNRDGLIFRVLSIPSYSVIHSESKKLVSFLQLPAFPPITSQSLLHPLNLSRRYMTELNLPDEMSKWVESVLDQADLMTSSCLTFDPSRRPKPRLPHYELLAAAAIVVAMKLLFGLDDKTEWELSSEASSDESGDVFSVRRWYRLLQAALLRSHRRRLHLKAQKQWVPKNPFYFTHKEKIVALKRRRVSVQLTSCFKRLSSDRDSDTHSAAQRGGACTSHFLWGRGLDADGRSMRHMTLKGGARISAASQLSDESYWHAPFTDCRRHLWSLRADVPRMFLWLLDLFCFVLQLKWDVLFQAVSTLERILFKSQNPRSRKNLKRRQKNTETRESPEKPKSPETRKIPERRKNPTRLKSPETPTKRLLRRCRAEREEGTL